METFSYHELVNRYKREAEEQTEREHALWDAYVQLGRLPDPKRILPIERKFFEEEMMKLPVHFHIDEAAEAWHRTQQRVRQMTVDYIQKLKAQQEQPEPPPQPPTTPKTTKRRTNPGVQAHANAIQRLINGQERQANYYQWRTEYQAERGAFTEKSTPENELYRKNVWNPYQKKLTGKI